MTTKCNAESWTGSGDRKGTLMEKQVKSKRALILIDGNVPVLVPSF